MESDTHEQRRQRYLTFASEARMAAARVMSEQSRKDYLAVAEEWDRLAAEIEGRWPPTKN